MRSDDLSSTNGFDSTSAQRSTGRRAWACAPMTRCELVAAQALHELATVDQPRQAIVAGHVLDALRVELALGEIEVGVIARAIAVRPGHDAAKALARQGQLEGGAERGRRVGLAFVQVPEGLNQFACRGVHGGLGPAEYVVSAPYRCRAPARKQGNPPLARYPGRPVHARGRQRPLRRGADRQQTTESWSTISRSRRARAA